MESNKRERGFFFAALVVAFLDSIAVSQIVYVDSLGVGRDQNAGTSERPVRTLRRAAEIINGDKEPGPAAVKISPGVYTLTESVTFGGNRAYSEESRLVIEASILPDDPKWEPGLMPIIVSTEDPRKQDNPDKLTETYGLKIEVGHVTIRGLKFMGNPLARNWHCCISRIGEDLDDLLVTQCMFVGDGSTLDIYCAALATGNRFIVDHCIFRNCHACTVFWDGARGIAGKGCSMRYCIVDGAYIAGVWTCQTAEDFEFHHNIVTRGEYFWMRKETDASRRYRVRDCIITDNRHYSGYGVESGPTGQTGPEVTFEESNVVRQGHVTFETNKAARLYLHVTPNSLGSHLGAGLFTRQVEK
ncbi:MAG: hypothetical protein A2Z25_06380 [Planctomycetes bacterium RBG_16_55_9]|nr:MAG: hypothetical protein A2Z25_06380 [Planctomycetes bacterium RBG_16_55_9]